MRKYDHRREMSLYKIVKVDGLNQHCNSEVVFNLFTQYGYIILIKVCSREDSYSVFV